MRLRILILGRTGQLGWELNRTAACVGDILSYDYPQVDFLKPGLLEAFVTDLKPHLIFNAVAYTAVDRAESEPEAARLVNGVAPGVLAEAALKVGAALIHYSTDFVFNGTKGTPYAEEDAPDPLNVYGQTKLEGEQAAAAAGGACLILRTSWVYSTRRDSFVTKVLSWARQHETVRVVSDQTGSPTWARMLAEISTQAVVMGGKDPLGWIGEKRGVYHLGGDGSASRYEWAQEILANDPKPQEQVLKSLQPSSTREFPTPAQRPACTPLNCDRFERAFGLRLPDWRTSLKLAMESDQA